MGREDDERRNDVRAVNNYNDSRSDANLTEASSARPGMPERNRSHKAELIKAPAEAPEVISVEMTGDEQQMYALMGISPLLVSSETVKNPRTALVTVRLPGAEPVPIDAFMDEEEPEKPTLSPTPTETEEESESIHVIDAAPSESKSQLPILDLKQQSNPVVEEAVLEETDDSEEIVNDLEDSIPEEEIDEDPLEEDSSEEEQSPIIRRRRRRSSAVSE